MCSVHHLCVFLVRFSQNRIYVILISLFYFIYHRVIPENFHTIPQAASWSPREKGIFLDWNSEGSRGNTVWNSKCVGKFQLWISRGGRWQKLFLKLLIWKRFQFVNKTQTNHGSRIKISQATGLQIMAGQQTMSGQNWVLTRQILGLPDMLSGHLLSCSEEFEFFTFW